MADEKTKKGGGGEEEEEEGGSRAAPPLYTPHLKRVLKSYQAAATTSLHGPDSVLVAAAPEATGGPEPPFVAPPPAPPQQPPLLAPADRWGGGEGAASRPSTTLLEGEPISCFGVGGEERLCLPQILNSVLRAFSLHQINGVCDALHIFCSRCDAGQVGALKAEGVLPPSAPSCGLITKTDAERLCAALISPLPPRIPDCDFPVPVYHECFGRCRGRYSPALYQAAGARCIECAQCRGVLSPRRFVCHAHPPGENRTCHWGFDSQRWRRYLRLDEGAEGGRGPAAREALRQMKARFADHNHKYKRKQLLAEGCDVKRAHVDHPGPPLVCWYGAPGLWGAPGLLSADGKFYLAPPALPTADDDLLFKDRLEGSYLGPKLEGLVGPENQVTLTYHVREERKTTDPHPCRTPSAPGPDLCSSEDALSDTSFSTLSAGTEDGAPVSCAEEAEPVEGACPEEGEELQRLDEMLEEVDTPLRARILAEVESLIAKYRKCLSVAVQGKKMYQMELEKFNYVQRGKIRKLRETNKYLEKKMRRLQREESSGEPPPPPPPAVDELEEEEAEAVATEEPPAEGGGSEDA